MASEIIGSTRFRSYHEPFAGGAALFFGLEIDGPACLSDLNGSLIDMYKEVRDNPDQVWRFLRRYNNSEGDYYSAREAAPRTAASRAARFIYLNHTSFNGIYRVNLAGRYNVPYGYRDSYNIPLLADLVAASNRLKNATLTCSDFEESLTHIASKDLVFLDPLYRCAQLKWFREVQRHSFSFPRPAEVECRYRSNPKGGRVLHSNECGPLINCRAF